MDFSLTGIPIWKPYKECVLKAVNLGGDTDTTGAIAGGLAGILYGHENIPNKWLNQLVRKHDIEDLAEKLNHSLSPFQG